MRAIRTGAVLLLIVALPACQSVTMVRSRHIPSADDIASALGVLHPSEATATVLARHGIASGLRFDPDAAVRRLPDEPTPAVRAARAELLWLAGRESEAWNGPHAARQHAAAIAASYSVMQAPEATPDQIMHAAHTYNAACARFLQVTSSGALKLDADWYTKANALGVNVARSQAGNLWEPDRFRQYLDVDDYVVTGYRQRHRTNGLGVRLMGVRERDADDGAIAKFVPGRQCNAVTALLRPEADDGSKLTLELHDPLRTERVAVAARTATLASDLTAPLAYQIANSDLAWVEQLGMFDPLRQERNAGVYALHPYQRGKIPVVFVHGLWSSPRAWIEAINDLQADPVLRERYQFWVFFYPTGNPFIKSAAMLRESLKSVRQTFDPDGTDPAFDQMVLVGHSMGGLLTKAMIQGSGDDLWGAVARGPFTQLKANDDQKQLLQAQFFYDPQPCVKRAIFVATPHRGSWFGNMFLGRLGDRLIHLPNRIRANFDGLVRNNPPDYFTETFKGGLPSSIDLLEWHNPVLAAMDKRPFADGVQCHSIIGKLIGSKLEESSDGVVAYSSSHIDGVVSETVVADGHNCTTHPETIAEIRRILHEHGIHHRDTETQRRKDRENN